MRHIDVGTLIWIVAVVIGVVSSMVKKKRQAPAATRAPAVTMSMPASPPAVQVPVAPAVAAPPIVVASPKPRVKAPKAPAAPMPPPAHGTPVFRGMFERGALVRAVVAAEVLGPPKALQEQSIWSPRHSEPSI